MIDERLEEVDIVTCGEVEKIVIMEKEMDSFKLTCMWKSSE